MKNNDDHHRSRRKQTRAFLAAETGKTYQMTTSEAATAAHMTIKGIQSAIHTGRLSAIKIGRDWWIERRDFDRWFASPRKAGRPRKEK